MENVSKALLIAGAILIAIILISVGVIVINSPNDIISNAKDNSAANAVLAWNNRFTTYTGIQSGRKVQELLNLIIIENSDSDRSGERIKIDIGIYCSVEEVLDQITYQNAVETLKGNRDFGVRYAENILMVSNAINIRSKYKISFGTNEEGYIWKVYIDNP